MGWLASLGVAVLTGVVSLVASLVVGALAVDWYRISSFEGGAGYFVVGMGFVGLVGGGVIGLVLARVVAARPQPGFFKALAASCGVVIAIIGGIGGTARLLADIPPEIDGEELFILTELRWPKAGVAPPSTMPGPGEVRLGASSGSIVRVQEGGPLFLEDAKDLDGRWVVPGAVRIFTSRGERLLMFAIGEKTLAGFVVPLGRHPGVESRVWSPWLPMARPGAQALPDQFTYRYRVVRQSEPLRSDTVGAFRIETAVQHFFHVTHSERFAAEARFRVLYNGAPIGDVGDVRSVAVLGGAKTALLVHVTDEQGPDRCRLISNEGDRVRVDVAGPCTAPIDGRPLTSDAARFRAANDKDLVPGWIDRVTFATPGLYRVGTLVIDTRSLQAFRFEAPSEPSPVTSVPPLGLSPDERSLVWLGLDGSEDKPLLAVTDFRTSRTRTVPVDRLRMRYNTFASLDPAWVAHHFTWRRGDDGVDTLVARAGFTPLPYRGEVTAGKPGEYQSYTLRPGSEPLRAAIVALMVTDLGGERLADELNGYQQRVKIEGEILNVTVGESPSYVAVSTYKGDPSVMSRLAARLDAALATGKYDALFTSAGAK